MRRKILALLLALVMLFSMLPMSVFADGTPYLTCGYYSEDMVSVTAGNSASIYIAGWNFQNLAAIDLEIRYDPEVMTVSGASAGNLLSGGSYSINTDTPGLVVLSAVSYTGVTSYDSFWSNILLSLNFRVSADCPKGKYPISVFVGEVYNTTFQVVEVSGTKGYLDVNVPMYGRFSFYNSVSDSTLREGDSTTVGINHYRYDLFAGATFQMEYDADLLRVDKVTLAPDMAIEGAVYSINADTKGIIRISYVNKENVSSYNLFTVEFTAIVDVDLTTALTVTSPEVYDEKHNPYQPGSMTINLKLEKKPVVVDDPDLYLETDKLIVGQPAVSTLYLDNASAVAAADFQLNYDATVLMPKSVSMAQGIGGKGAMILINPNYSGGVIKFSYVDEKPDREVLALITITWDVISSPASHYEITLSGRGVVDTDYNVIPLEYVTDTGCIYAVEVVDPFCETEGYTEYTCPCGDSYRTEFKDPLGHDYVSETVEPSCQTGGYTIHTCKNCGNDYTDGVTESTDHIYLDGICKFCDLAEEGFGVAAILQGGKYVSEYGKLSSAISVSASMENVTIRLLTDSNETIYVDGDLYLDLNGHRLEGLSVSGTVYGIDSTTDGYIDDYAGALYLVSGAVAPHIKTSTASHGAVRRYLAVPAEDGSWSFHRFYIGLTHISLQPDSAGFGYKAAFAGDDTVRNYLDKDQAFGLSVSVYGTPEDLSQAGLAAFRAEQFAQEGSAVTKNILVRNLLKPDLVEEEQMARSMIVLSACTFIRTADGTVIYSVSHSESLQSMMEKVDAGFNGFNALQRSRIHKFYRRYESTLSVWNLPNIKESLPEV